MYIFIQVKECLQSSTDILQHLLHKVCDKDITKNVELLLELGADPISEDEQGVAAVTKAALSRIEPLEKLRSLTKYDSAKVKHTCIEQFKHIKF